MDDPGRARALELLKELVRGLVDEVEANGEAIIPREVAEHALRGFPEAEGDARERQALLQEIVGYVRTLGGRTT